MQTNTVSKFSPIYTEDKKVEVSLENDQAVIKLSTWTEELGWCRQKTMSLDAEMLDELHRVISSARYRLNNRRDETEERAKPKNIISFPCVS